MRIEKFVETVKANRLALGIAAVVLVAIVAWLVVRRKKKEGFTGTQTAMVTGNPSPDRFVGSVTDFQGNTSTFEFVDTTHKIDINQILSFTFGSNGAAAVAPVTTTTNRGLQPRIVSGVPITNTGGFMYAAKSVTPAVTVVSTKTATVTDNPSPDHFVGSVTDFQGNTSTFDFVDTTHKIDINQILSFAIGSNGVTTVAPVTTTTNRGLQPRVIGGVPIVNSGGFMYAAKSTVPIPATSSGSTVAGVVLPVIPGSPPFQYVVEYPGKSKKLFYILATSAKVVPGTVVHLVLNANDTVKSVVEKYPSPPSVPRVISVEATVNGTMPNSNKPVVSYTGPSGTTWGLKNHTLIEYPRYGAVLPVGTKVSMLVTKTDGIPMGVLTKFGQVKITTEPIKYDPVRLFSYADFTDPSTGKHHDPAYQIPSDMPVTVGKTLTVMYDRYTGKVIRPKYTPKTPAPTPAASKLTTTTAKTAGKTVPKNAIVKVDGTVAGNVSGTNIPIVTYPNPRGGSLTWTLKNYPKYAAILPNGTKVSLAIRQNDGTVMGVLTKFGHTTGKTTTPMVVLPGNVVSKGPSTTTNTTPQTPSVVAGIVTSNPAENQFVAWYKVGGVAKTVPFTTLRYVTENQAVNVAVSGAGVASVDQTQFPARAKSTMVNNLRFNYGNLYGVAAPQTVRTVVGTVKTAYPQAYSGDPTSEYDIDFEGLNKSGPKDFTFKTNTQHHLTAGQYVAVSLDLRQGHTGEVTAINGESVTAYLHA